MVTCVKNDVGLERVWGSNVTQSWVSWEKMLNISPLLVDGMMVCVQRLEEFIETITIEFKIALGFIARVIVVCDWKHRMNKKMSI